MLNFMLNLKIQEKISLLLALYFLVALGAIGSTLYVSWRPAAGVADAVSW